LFQAVAGGFSGVNSAINFLDLLVLFHASDLLQRME
jgi:hypothetical protein